MAEITGAISIQNVSEALADITRPPMLIEGFIPRKGAVIIAAPTYTGKTFLALEMARAVAFGGRFLGQYPSARGRVLFVECDSPAWDLASQFHKVIGLPPDGLPPEEVENRYGGMRFITDPRFSLNTHADADLLIGAANSDMQSIVTYDSDGQGWLERRGGFDLIVFDTLVSIHQYDENSNREMQHVAELMRRVANETGAAIVMLHHFNKPFGRDKESSVIDRIRGASSLGGAVDGIFALTRKRNKDEINVIVAKNRAAPHMQDFSYRQVEDETGRVRLLVVGDDEKGELRKKIQATIEASKGEWVAIADLRRVAFEHLGVEPTSSAAQAAISKQVDKVLAALDKEQVIRRTYGKVRYSLQEVNE